LLLLLVLSACAEGDPASCRLDSFALAALKGQSPQSCGAFSLAADGGFSDADMQAAHDCVLEHVMRAEPFTLFYDVWDPYRHLRGGFTGSLESGKYETRAYAYVGDSAGGSLDPRPVLTAQSCVTIAAGGCTPAAGMPCLGCSGAGRADTLCRF
jgi:hypothetical protein